MADKPSYAVRRVLAYIAVCGWMPGHLQSHTRTEVHDFIESQGHNREQATYLVKPSSWPWVERDRMWKAASYLRERGFRALPTAEQTGKAKFIHFRNPETDELGTAFDDGAVHVASKFVIRFMNG